jgi:chromosome segregation ATPase
MNLPSQIPPPSTNIGEAVQKLKSTIGTINDKIQSQTTSANGYKNAILERISQISNSIINIKNSIGNVGGFKRQLDEANANISQINQQLVESQNTIKTQQERIADLTTNIEQLRQEITRLTNEKNTTDEMIKGLNAEKTQLEQQLEQSQNDLLEHIKSIDDLNTQLVSQVGLIDTLIQEFNIEEPLNSSLETITTNIEEIMRDLGQPRQQDPNVRGGKKKITKKRKQRGGYIYASNKMLDKSSSIISQSRSKRITNKHRNVKVKK